MNRIDKCFREKKDNILSIYFTAGFPELNDTTKIIKALDDQGADMVEIGMPFSDPVADGPVIQQSSKEALNKGMSLKLLFQQLSDIRKITDIPVILMGYLNPVYKMGMENFLERCSATGIDGIILPDFPPEEFEKYYMDSFRKAGIYNIMLVTPQTPEERIRKIDELSRGFIYMVSSYATTGVKNGFGEIQIEYFKRIRDLKLKNPTLTGFGISNEKTYKTACEYSSGAIIGSAFIKALRKEGKLEENIKNFMNSIRP